MVAWFVAAASSGFADGLGGWRVTIGLMVFFYLVAVLYLAKAIKWLGDNDG